MTVKEILLGLNFSSNHICIKIKEGNHIVPLGGGTPDRMIRLYPDCIVERSVIIDNVLVLFVQTN